METWIRKRNHESREEYVLRVYKKYIDNEIGMTTKELGEFLNIELEESLDESVRRKKAQLILDSNYTDAIYKIFGNSKKILNEIKGERKRLQKELRKIRDEKLEDKRDIRNESRVESILEYMDIYTDRIAESNKFKLPIYKEPRKDSAKAILLLSDIHYGILIDNHWNKYSPEIAFQLADRLADEVVRYCRMYDIDELLFANLGDNVEGNLHTEARVESNRDLAEQVMEAPELISNIIEKIARQVNIVYISTVDNHSRVNKKYKEHIESESWVKVIDRFIYNRFKDTDRVRFDNNSKIDPTMSVIEFGGQTIVACHGHLETRNKTALFSKMTKMVGKVPDKILMGHWHDFETWGNSVTRVIINGTMKGTDAYSKNKRLSSFNSKSQVLNIIDGSTEVLIDVDLN